tara:strand:+ start:7369 stop:8283 length:915 start_codon:yes stop_codon:yes gene_type:complete
MTNILIIGANGFIGSNLTRSLINEDNEICTITKRDSDEWRLREIKKSYKKYFTDITDYEKLHKGVFNLEPDVVINCATYGVYPTQKDPEKIFQNNIIGTKNMIDVIKDYNKIEKIINIGSYLELLDSKEEHGHNWEYYASTKSKQTELIHEFGNKSGIPVSTLRLFNPYGMYESPGRLVCDIMIALIRKKKLEIFSKTAKHNFYHIDDVIESIKELIYDSRTDDKIFNLRTMNDTSVESVVNIASQITNYNLEVVWKDEDQREIQGKCKLRQTNDQIINPKIPLETGLSETFSWFKKNIDLYGK